MQERRLQTQKMEGLVAQVTHMRDLQGAPLPSLDRGPTDCFYRPTSTLVDYSRSPLVRWRARGYGSNSVPKPMLASTISWVFSAKLW